MIGTIVLAAGASTRMGSPKALLPDPDGCPFIVRILRTVRAAGLDDVVVVTGARHAEIAAAVEQDPTLTDVRLARNPDPSRGQLSSIWTGMDAVIRPQTEAIAIMLVDVPMTAEATVRSVVDTWRRTHAPIVRPAVGSLHGHPVIFSRPLFQELREAPLDRGGKVVVRAHEAELVNVAVEDRGCVSDVDTPADYQALREGRLGRDV